MIQLKRLDVLFLEKREMFSSAFRKIKLLRNQEKVYLSAFKVSGEFVITKTFFFETF